MLQRLASVASALTAASDDTGEDANGALQPPSAHAAPIDADALRRLEEDAHKLSASFSTLMQHLSGQLSHVNQDM